MQTFGTLHHNPFWVFSYVGKKRKIISNFHWHRWGSSLPGLRAGPSSHPPIKTSGNLLVHVSERGVKKIEKFRRFLSLFIFSRKKNLKIDTPGARVPPFFCTPNLIFLCDLKPHAKFQNPTITPSGRKVTGSEKKERKNCH